MGTKWLNSINDIFGSEEYLKGDFRSMMDHDIIFISKKSAQ